MPCLPLRKHYFLVQRRNIPSRTDSDPCAPAIPDGRLMRRLNLNDDHVTIRERKAVDGYCWYGQDIPIGSKRREFLQQFVSGLQTGKLSTIANADKQIAWLACVRHVVRKRAHRLAKLVFVGSRCCPFDTVCLGCHEEFLQFVFRYHDKLLTQNSFWRASSDQGTGEGRMSRP